MTMQPPDSRVSKLMQKKKAFKMKIRMEKGSKNGGKERVQGQDVVAGL